MHSKIVYVDGKTLLVGSANLNRQATKRLCELDVLIHGTNLPFKKRLHQSIRNAIKDSVKVSGIKQLEFSRIRAFFERLVC